MKNYKYITTQYESYKPNKTDYTKGSAFQIKMRKPFQFVDDECVEDPNRVVRKPGLCFFTFAKQRDTGGFDFKDGKILIKLSLQELATLNRRIKLRESEKFVHKPDDNRTTGIDVVFNEYKGKVYCNLTAFTNNSETGISNKISHGLSEDEQFLVSQILNEAPRVMLGL